MGTVMDGHPFTRRDYMRLLAMSEGVPWALTGTHVDTLAAGHPEWDMAERRPLACWLLELPPSGGVPHE